MSSVAANGASIDSLIEGSLGGQAATEDIVASTPVPNPPQIETIKPRNVERDEPRGRHGKERGGHTGRGERTERSERSESRHGGGKAKGGGHSGASHASSGAHHKHK